jgi:hypothetical protein
MSMRVRITAVAFAFAVLPTAVGCSTGGNASHSPSSSAPGSATAAVVTPSIATPASPTATTVPGRWTADAITKAITAINQKIGADPADYVSIDFNVSSAIAKAIDPQKRQNVDAYTYDGTGVTVAPVDVSHSDPGAVQESAFKSNTLKPDVLVKAMASAPNDSGVDGVQVQGLDVKKFLADDPAPQLLVNVKGPRASKLVEYDMNGVLTRVV